MSSRRQHIEEMRYALAHNVTLPEAKRRLARRRQIEADQFMANLQNCGTRTRAATDGRSGEPLDPVGLNGVSDQPWMMRH